MDKLWRLYSGAAGILLAALVAAGIALAGYGAIRGDRLEAAVRALREDPVRPAPTTVEAPSAPDEAERRQASTALAGREEELRRLDARVAARHAQVEAERARTAEASARLKADREAFERERSETVSTKTDADLAANVPILSKLEGPSIVAALRGSDNATFVRYLRALRPSKAAEVLESLRVDPAFEQEFRRVPAGAPRGARPRAELLMEEFRKAPQG